MIIYFISLLINGLFWGFATRAVIKNKNYDSNWFWWGFFFGFIAFIIALTKPENHNISKNHISITNEKKGWRCPKCGNFNPTFYVNCSNCNYDGSNETTKIINNNSTDTWTCSCGKVLPSYVGTCSCGNHKK